MIMVNNLILHGNSAKQNNVLNFSTELIDIAQLAKLDPTILVNCLTKADHNWRYADSESHLDASKTRDTLCRTIYGRLFTWIVRKINESLKVITGLKFN